MVETDGSQPMISHYSAEKAQVKAEKHTYGSLLIRLNELNGLLIHLAQHCLFWRAVALQGHKHKLSPLLGIISQEVLEIQFKSFGMPSEDSTMRL